MQASTELPRKVTVLGAGAWGTAVAMSMAARNDVLIWGRNAQAMADMDAARDNTHYLPGFPLPDSLRVSADFEQALAHVAGAAAAGNAAPHDDAAVAQALGYPSPLLVLACPVAGLRPLLEQLKGRDIPNLVWLCKGFEGGTGMLPHQVVRDVLGDAVAGAALSGPSFAQEVARGLPCALTVASTSKSLCDLVVAADDVVGVEVGGAVKNVLAIATGVADGLGLGLNARAALITRGLAEITRLGSALGGNMSTFMGLTGMGDLILTCTGDLSRNRRVGTGLAAGKPLDVIVSELGHVAEGVPCAKAVRELAARMGVDMPITNAVAGVLFDGDSPKVMVARLLARGSRDEIA